VPDASGFFVFYIVISEMEAFQTKKTDVIHYHDRKWLNAGAFKDIIGTYAEE
jgi:hypothetical protein